MMKIKDFAELAHNNSVYLPTRTIFLTGEVDIDMYELAIKNLHILDTQPETVTIYLNSEGGSVTQAFAIYNAIRAMKSMVRIVAWGEVSSAASMILQGGDDRIMAPDCEMMVHIGEEGYAQNHPAIIDNWYKHNKKIGEKMKQVYLEKIRHKKPRYTKAKFEELWQFDKILSPKEAVELGLADKILEGSL